ncbi:MAG: hypothetical protein LBS74_06115 [Oscillospiraceae bacterium]|jgi:hypothetical protein|nr:hypothetical protein [Oscillospiraceae bacterium]
MTESLAFSITAIAVGISKGKESSEIGLLANIFTQIGDTLATIAAAKLEFEEENK